MLAFLSLVEADGAHWLIESVLNKIGYGKRVQIIQVRHSLGQDSRGRARAEGKGSQHERDQLEKHLKEGFKKLQSGIEVAEAKAREDSAMVSMTAAGKVAQSSGDAAAAAMATPELSGAYYEALKPKTMLSTECKPKVNAEGKSSIKAWMGMSWFD